MTTHDDTPRRVFAFSRSPLTRRIVLFNLLAVNLLAAGLLYLAAVQSDLVDQRAESVETHVRLLAGAVAAAMPDDPAASLAPGSGVDPARLLERLDLPAGAQAFVLSRSGLVLAQRTGAPTVLPDNSSHIGPATRMSDTVEALWMRLQAAAGRPAAAGNSAADLQILGLRAAARVDQTRVAVGAAQGQTRFAAVSPVYHGARIVGSVGLTVPGAGVDSALRAQRERLMQVFVLAVLLSVELSIVMASSIARPITALAEAAEGGRRARRAESRIALPDLTARPDEIGRLSGALRGMVSALYDQIDGNEQFAADVSHEIKNPLASLRSAVGALRRVSQPEQRAKLLDVIDHDVRRLDRLVTDISNASRLDSELVREEEEEFNILDMVGRIAEFLAEQARAKGVEFITDLPRHPVLVLGLEPRLAQVVVNLISNAISFCQEGDAIRVWVRRRDNRVLLVVEDTGPGIPEDALEKIFRRFYTSRPDGDFGNNSGLGLAISKQIVEAHGGVIWAENIRAAGTDAGAPPLGARFVVGLPV